MCILMQVQEKYFLKNTESKVTFLVCLQICFSSTASTPNLPNPSEIHSDLMCVLCKPKKEGREKGRRTEGKIKSKSTLTGRERRKAKSIL